MINQSARGQSGSIEKCSLCRRPLGERSSCLDGMCRICAEEVAAYLHQFGLADHHRGLAIEHLWQIGAALNRYGHPEDHHLPELAMCVPTYFGEIRAHTPSPVPKSEFDAPMVPVLVRWADGVRIVLGSHNHQSLEYPDIQVERRPQGWAIFLHPLGGSDPSGYVYFHDDGRSFLVPENGIGPTPAIVLREYSAAVAEIDGLQGSAANEGQDANQDICEFCGIQLDNSRDNWDGLCPECADFVSMYLDRKGLTDENRDAAIKFLKTGPM